MGSNSNIQWTDHTWNVARGCTKVDEDCKFCYMYRDSFDSTRYDPLQVVRTKTVFNLPLKLKEPSKIFTSSLTDFFHPDIDSYRDEAWEIIRKCPQHIFQILTKRPERIADNLPSFFEEIKSRCWFGTSIGSEKGIMRMYDLLVLKFRVGTLFLSMEPLYDKIALSKMTFNIEGDPQRFNCLDFIDWVIVGGESGHETGKYRYRPCEIEWIDRIVNDCKQFGVPVFVKQLGTHLAKKMNMSDRHGGNIEEFPERLRIREFPETIPSNENS